jgi:TRAP-type C4-dicarboxylate transport system substrate-binding protein
MRLICLLTILIFALPTYAIKLKIGVLAPEGTNWAKHMKKMAKEVKKATNKKVKFKFYFGGSQGDEHDVLRKVRIGQLAGGVFTGKTLGDINGDVRVVEIPFTFEGDRAKAWNAVEKLGPFFNQKFEKANFKNLGFFELGMVYFVSQKKVPNLDSLKGIKIWSWEGDKIVSTMINTMNLVSVPLPLPDVLSSLSTGIIQAAYAPPMGMVALQWNTKIKYLVDFPIAYSVGAFLIDQKKWKKVSPEHKKIVQELATKYLAKVNESNQQDNIDALKAVKSAGVEYLKFPPADVKKAKSLRVNIVKELKGKLFSEDALKRLDNIL